MNFRHTRGSEPPEINLIPFIDVLLVVLIFLMLTTTFSRYTELSLTLPTADAAPQRPRTQALHVVVSAQGRYAVNQTLVSGQGVAAVTQALEAAAGSDGQGQVVIVHADALAPHQAVISVLEATRRAGLAHVTFATQSPSAAAR